MDEDQILQSIVADPQLTDPSIDVGQLRQTTETNPLLLANVPEFSGLQFDPTQRSYIEDLYAVYGGGLPMIPDPVVEDTAQIPGAIDTLVDVGGGGGMNQMTGDTAQIPGAIDTLVDVAPDTQPMTGDITVENIAQNQTPYDIPMDLSDPGASIENIIAQQNLKTIQEPPVISQQLQDQGPTTIEGPLSQVQVDGGLSAIDAERLADYKPSFETPEQQESFLQNVLGKAGQTVEGALNELGKVPGAIVDFGNQTVDIFGKKLNVGKTLASALINKLAGGPISLVFDALGALEPDKYNEEAQEALGEIGMLKTTEGGLTVDKYGKNIQSAFGDYDDYNLERQIDLQEKINDGTIQEFKEDGSLTYLGQELEDRKEIEKKLNKTRLEEAKQEQQDFVEEIKAQPVVQSGSQEADNQQRDTGVSKVETNQGTRYETSSGDRYASAEEAAEKGDGGGSSGGGKIVCTMMNESYGFGSFRNKIWLRHSKDLAPEYQIGYHKIFLPLVRLSKTNRPLKKTLEHIAVHRTIDIRQESRGKVHLLGRIYRKILEPICYWVGKYAKR